MANIHDITRDRWMLYGPLSGKGYDWWWHSMTAENAETGEKKAFYLEFFTCNPALAEDEPVIVWNDPEAQAAGRRPSYLMVNAGFWGEDHGQLHRFFSLKDADIHAAAPYSIKAGDCRCSEVHTEGSIKVTPEEAAAHPEWMSAFEMFWHAEGMKSAFTGEITLNGVKYLLKPETCNGYSDKNWGGDFTSPWVWLSSNNLRSMISGKKLENSVFNIGGGRPKVFGIALNRKLLGEFYYEGKDYEFNFSKFWTLSRTKFDCRETEDEIHWHVLQTTRNAKLDTQIRCAKKEMLNISYEAPTGYKKHNRLWNGGTGTGTLKLYERSLFGRREKLIDEVYAEGIGCEYGEYCDPE